MGISETEKGPRECLERLEQLMVIFNGLQGKERNCCLNTRRFLRVPTIGSLDQLRGELHLRYGGRQFWVSRGCGRIDAMLLSCSKDDENLFAGPVLVWCNPNAGYYETMVFESQWLDFYLSQGCSIFLFNYSGFGRSGGQPSPATLASDGDAVIKFLVQRGAKQIGVHGRSIGGIAACHLAARHPDVIRYLVADRTFSTLSRVAKCTFGKWAAAALALSATWADNARGFAQATCYKVLVCDPKDGLIPDQSALRTATALSVVASMTQEDQFRVNDPCVERFVESWNFLKGFIKICSRPASNCTSDAQAAGKVKSQVTDLDVEASQRLVPQTTEMDGPKSLQWLEEHWDGRQSMSRFGDAIQTTLTEFGSILNAGMSLNDAFTLAYGNPCNALRSFLANLQVWGASGSCVPPFLRSTLDTDMELFLSQSFEEAERPLSCKQMEKISQVVSPEYLAKYHRCLARVLTSQARTELQRRLVPVRNEMNAALCEDDPLSVAVCALAMRHLREVEAFAAALDHFFQRVHRTQRPEAVTMGNPTSADEDDSDVEAALGSADSLSAIPELDRTKTGYLVTITCGHNGALVDGELRHLAMHMREAKFGRYSSAAGKEKCAIVGVRRMVFQHALGNFDL